MRRGLLLLVAGGVSVALQAPAVALPASPAEAPARRARGGDGFALLERAARAARTLSYRGTQMVSFWSDSGSTSAVLDVVHVAGDGLLVRVAPTPQNPGGAVYDDESGDVPEVVGFAKGTLALLADNYDAGVEGTGEVAGRTADVVAVRRPGSSPAARFWIDRATALPLRREVLDGDGRTVRESAFLQVLVGDAHVSDTVAEQAGAAPAVVGFHVPDRDFVGLRRGGWQVHERLAGMELFEGRVIGSGDDTTLQLSYSDGLSTASVFQQRGRLDTRGVAGWPHERIGGADVRVQGAFPRRVVFSGGGIVYTVVADCPQATLDALVRALPHGGDPKPGIAARLGHGIARVGSWLNPFA